MSTTYSAGIATAYGAAVRGGYTGTYAQFCEDMANLPGVVETLENITATATTLPAGSDATASYSDGEFDFGIPKGDKGDKGNTGATGATGNGIASITKTSTAGLVDTYTITFTDGTTTTFDVTNGQDGEVTEARLAEVLEDYAETDGSYDEMTVGNAEQLLSTVGATDSVPYLFRASGGSIDIGGREMDKLVGGTVAWNQIARNSYAPSSRSGLTITKSDDSFIVEGTASALASASGWFDLETANVMPLENHVLLMDYQLISGTVSSGTVKFGVYYTKSADLINLGETKFKKVPTGLSTSTARSYWEVSSGTVFTSAKMRVQVFDLTQMFGTTIADYLYTLESGSSGSGIAKLKSWGFCTKDYYAYNAGDLLPVKTSEHRMVGFNQWDEEWELGIYDASGQKHANNSYYRSKNYIPVLSNTTYYLKTPTGTGRVCYYDSNKTFLSRSDSFGNDTFTTPNGCSFITFFTSESAQTYRNNICINISGSKNGTYEPYSVRSYPLDNDLVLRGTLKLDASNNLRYDGDTYESDGTVTRRYGIVDLGSLSWSYVSSDERFIGSLPVQAYATVRTNAICSARYLANALAYNDADRTYGIFCMTKNTVIVRDNNYSDKDTFKASLSGVYLVYELDPSAYTTESADPYTNPQIVNDWGTEEYVDTREVPIPVGHETYYPENLRKKIEDLPWNFSTLIAPTESGMTATRNYSVNDFLIVGNQLYKVTANIGSGGAITVGSNVTATTLGAEITALLNA